MVQPVGVQVPVPGGELYAGVWGNAGTTAATSTAVAFHGVTASHMSWAPVAAQLPDGLRLAAPDLRGRGRSRDLPGPYGMARHADDALALLDHLGVPRATVVGHSMGGFVAVVFAHRHPERVGQLVLIDGGLPLPPVPGLTPEENLHAIIGPAAQRLAMTFESYEAHRAFWRRHPALAEHWNPAVEAYVDYDLVGEPPNLRSSVVFDAVREDSIDLHTGAAAAEAIRDLAHPTVFLQAERGLFNEERSLYDPQEVKRYAAEFGLRDARVVAGTNHYTILLDSPGAPAVAQEIVAAVSRG